MDVLSYVLEQTMPIAVALFVLGVFFKKSPMKDWVIPFVLIGIGIALAVVILPIAADTTYGDAVVQGILAAGLAVLTNELKKQATEKRE